MFGLERIITTFWGWGFLYYLSGGVSMPQVSSLNDYLWRHGYPGVPGAYLTYSTRWSAFVKGYSLSHTSGGILGVRGTYGDRIVSVGGEYHYYSVGRLLTLKSKTLYVHPSVGVGRSRLTLTVGSNVVEFDSLLASPGQVSVLTSSSWVVVPEMDLLWRKEGFLFLGMGVGYMLAFPKGSWVTEGIGVRNGPSTAMDGLLFNLRLGLGFVVL